MKLNKEYQKWIWLFLAIVTVKFVFGWPKKKIIEGLGSTSM